MANGYMNGTGHETGNGALPVKPKRQRAAPQPRPVVDPLHGVSRLQIISVAAAIIGSLVAAGWLTLPAKQSDLDELKTAVKDLAIQVQATGARIDTLRTSVEGYREQVVRVMTLEEVRASAAPSAAPSPRPRKIITKRIEATKPEPTFFGGILSGGN